MKATVCIVPYNNNVKFLDILDRVLEADGKFNVIVVDNNKHPVLRLVLDDYPIKYVNNGNKGQLAGACNLAVSMTDTEYFIYVCSNHTEIFFNSWLDDMVSAMDISGVAIGGTVSLVRRGQDHVQGGVFIARTEILKEIPYDSINYPFTFMDVYLSNKIKEAGYEFLDIPIVHSVMGKPRRRNHQKIVHAHIFEYNRRGQII